MLDRTEHCGVLGLELSEVLLPFLRDPASGLTILNKREEHILEMNALLDLILCLLS